MPNEAKLIHISDLHFSGNELGTHSVPHLIDLASKIKATDFDRLIISGDISDQGDMHSLRLAHDWIFTGRAVLEDRTIPGLNLEPHKVIPVPGNHDAFDNLKERGLFFRNLSQHSVLNYNMVFENHQFERGMNFCRYDWLDKKDWGIWIVSLDTCYHGDFEITNFIGRIPVLSKTAKGKLAREQAQQILQWYDKGVQGRLIVSGSSSPIPKDKFCRSFKIIVMHHYLMEPDGHISNYSLRISDRHRAIRDLAMVDFDLILCGHKHYSFARAGTYARLFETRGRKRLAFSYLRRILGISSLPSQMSYRGKYLSKYVTAVAEWLYVKDKSTINYAQDEDYIGQVIDRLYSTLHKPSLLKKEIEEFLKNTPIDDGYVVDNDEIEELQQRIGSLTGQQKKALKKKAENITIIIKQLSRRVFFQSMSGSATKKSKTNKPRSFDTINIARESEGFAVDARRYIWDAKVNGFGTKGAKFGHIFMHSRIMSH